MEEPQARIETDLRLQLPNSALFIGASMSGKTTLVLNLLRKPSLFNPPPKRVLFYYDIYQPVYGETKAELAAKGIDMLLYKGFTGINLDSITPIENGETILLIDDFSEATSASSELARIATNGRHKNISLWLIWHQLFSKHPPSRTIAQNIRYYFFLPSLRLESQLRILGSQLGMSKDIVSAFRHCLNESKYTYLMLDAGPTTNTMLRLRSAIHDPDRQFCFFSSV